MFYKNEFVASKDRLIYAGPMSTGVISDAPSLEELLHDRGMRATPQRQIIHRVVCDRPKHVTAEQVRSAVKDLIPGISLPTVYATLDLFVDLGLLHRIPTLSGPTLYDSDRRGPHSHMVCRSCSGIFDLDISPLTDDVVRAARAQGFRVDAGDLVISGLCATCRAKGRA